MDAWTVETLRLHLQSQHDDLVALLNERQHVNEQRFDAGNRFRDQLDQQAHAFVTRHEYDAKHETLSARIAGMEHKLDQLEGRSAGVRLSAGAIVGTLSGLAALVTVVVVITDWLTH